MSSSTSSSRSDAVWTGLVSGIVLLAFYEGAIRMGHVPPGEGASIAQANVVNQERLAHLRGMVPLVLAGSSLTANLPEGLVTDGAVNAGLRGGSVRTVLQALLRSKIRPKVVLVEMNAYLMRDADATMLEGLFNPITLLATDSVWAFQQRYSPFDVLATGVRRRAYGKGGRPERQVAPAVRQAAIDAALVENRRSLTPWERERLDFALADVRHQIENLTSRGVVVLLHRIPEEPVVDASVKKREIDAEVLRAFPANRYQWVYPRLGRVWRTNDAEHLIPGDAAAYAISMRSQVQPYLLNLRLKAFGPQGL